MQLQKDLWIEGAYYLDIDHLGQMRIVGPNNHLHFGTVGLDRRDITIDEVYSQRGELVVNGHFKASAMFFHDPVVAHIMKVRYYIDRPGRKPSFIDVVKKNPQELAPNYIGVHLAGDKYEVEYKRLYYRHWYGIKLTLAAGVGAKRSERKRGFNLEAADGQPIGFTLTTEADLKPHSQLEVVVKPTKLDTGVFGRNQRAIDFLLDRTAIEITHLVRNNKTSGFDYGTVFPRDWMESADLGQGDLMPSAVEYMYHKAFEFVSPQGVGWHENAVGEFEFEKKQEVSDLNASVDALIDQSSRVGSALKQLIEQVEDLYIIRNMVDIEPRYILGLEASHLRRSSKIDLERIRKVARYIMLEATNNDIITFKKIPPILRRHKHDEYLNAGNWRDSANGFRMVHPVIAPYDVNVVFYPQALRIIRRHAKMLDVKVSQLDALIDKWDKVKQWYRFTNRDGQSAFALALYDIHTGLGGLEYKRLEVNHLDEAYELFYGQPVESDLISFCRRLLDPKYFYSKSGPLIVGAREEGYDTTHYHGKVIWTKQTAFTVAGLERQLKNKWPASTKQLMQRALLTTARCSIDAFVKLGGAPELHYDDHGHPRFYSDQSAAEGPMNTVQLWSAVGARRIIKTYIEASKNE